MGSTGIHAFWVIFRFHGREGGKVEKEEQSHGSGAGLIGGFGTFMHVLLQ